MRNEWNNFFVITKANMTFCSSKSFETVQGTWRHIQYSRNAHIYKDESNNKGNISPAGCIKNEGVASGPCRCLGECQEWIPTTIPLTQPFLFSISKCLEKGYYQIPRQSGHSKHSSEVKSLRRPKVNGLSLRIILFEIVISSC